MFAVIKSVGTRLQSFHQTLLRQSKQQRHFWKNMECNILQPPKEVRGMTQLQREAFRKVVQVPKLRILEEQANKVLPLLKKFLLKMNHLQPVKTITTSECSGKVCKEILLHPLPVHSWDSLPTADLEQLQVTSADFFFGELELSYENWRADEIFKYVLPIDKEGLTSFSRIGHIVHLNLRDHLLPYKQLIGDVLRDKVAGCRTVVNKASTIDNTYRNFQLELVCGVPEYQVETKENGAVFEFDFSKVYWNPRLSTEHERIVQLLHPGDVLYDVFAGVGPFSVPAAKKGCTVLANDLNPESFKWLQHNAKRNKCLKHMRLFNKDGAEFIRTDVCYDFLQRWKQSSSASTGREHITMNLPAMAVEFLAAFRGLLFQVTEAENLQFPADMPMMHVYSFAKGEKTHEMVISLVEKHLGMLLGSCLEGVHFVRNVAPNKDMYRVSFVLSTEMLTTKNNAIVLDESEMEKVQKDEITTRKRSIDLQLEKDEQSSKIKCC